MKILFLTEGTTIPASRFRVEQFIAHFEAQGLECTVRAAYGDGYNAVAPTIAGPGYKLLWRLKRVFQGLDARRFDLIFLQRPALPFSAMAEQIVTAFNPRTILDIDDSIFLGPGGTANRARQRAFDREVELAHHIICGNTYLAEKTAARSKTTVIPTVIDTDRYTTGPGARRQDTSVTIGWMGTSSNFPFLEQITPSLLEVLQHRPQVRIRIVSNALFTPLAEYSQVEQINWSQHREIELLHSFDVGLMPLEDIEVAWGKCGFKMIQYMSVGKPVVASAVGANVDILKGSAAGFLLKPGGSWTEPLLNLVDDELMRCSMGEAGREHVVDKYSIKSVISQYLEIFEQVARK